MQACRLHSKKRKGDASIHSSVIPDIFNRESSEVFLFQDGAA